MSRAETIRKRLIELKDEENSLRDELYEIKMKDEDTEIKKLFEDVQIEVVSDSVIILRGGISATYPIEFMDKVMYHILDKLGKPYYNYFIEHSLDNPWVRIIVFNINNFNYADTIDDIVNKIKIH